MCIYQDLKDIRKKWNLDGYALAQILNVEYRALNDWENNRGNPDTRTLIRWADALGCNLKLEFRK
jgi:transcriptional regulator with XRE-family HTH domain